MEPLFAPDIHVFYEHTSIPLAVYYVEDGRFYAYLVSEGICRMYESTREEMMQRLNGDDPFVNIVEKQEMTEAVRDFSYNDAAYNVVFHEYIGHDRKLKTIHGVGTHEFTRDGRRYSVIRYDEISDSSRRMLFKDEEKEITDRDRLYYEIDDAIARSFTTVFYVDTADLSAHIVRYSKLGDMIKDDIDDDTGLKNVIETYANRFVYRDDAKGLIKLGDYEYVMQELRTSNPLYYTYRTIREGRMVYYRLKIIPFDNGRKLIYGFEYFDNQMRDKIRRENERETQTTLLAGLSCEFDMIWLVDAPIHHARLIRNNIKDAVKLEMLKETEGNYEKLLGNYIDKYVAPEDRERVYLLSNIDHLIRNTKDDEIYHINYNRINPEGVRNYIQLSVAKVIDEMGVVRLVVGFRNIDSIIEEEKNRRMLYSMAHMDNMTNVNNRRTFDEYMDANAALTVSDDLVFFSFDLNELKKANDSHGHEAGDELIIGAADCMKDTLGRYGRIYRIGGDEFAAIVTLADDKRLQVIKDLKDRFDNWKGKLYPKLSVSMGYVCASENPDMTIDEMRKEADKRMYAHKSEFYSKDVNDRRRSHHNR